MKTMKFFLVATVFIFVSTSFVSQSYSKVKGPKWMAGEWKGIGLQLNSPQTWSMELTVENNQYVINYPSLECGGKWELIAKSKSQAVFKEKIIKGVDRCVQGGKVVVTRVDENHISFSYFSPDSGKLEAHSTLINLKAIDMKKS